MKLHIIEKQDLDSCALLFSNVFSSEPWNEIWTKERALERLLHFYESKGFLGVIGIDDGAIGFVLGNIEPFCDGPLFYLREMCVSDEYQNKGVGSKLLEKLQLELNSLHVKSVYLATDNTIPAAHFYKNKGFVHSEKLGFYVKSL